MRVNCNCKYFSTGLFENSLDSFPPKRFTSKSKCDKFITQPSQKWEVEMSILDDIPWHPGQIWVQPTNSSLFYFELRQYLKKMSLNDKFELFRVDLVENNCKVSKIKKQDFQAIQSRCKYLFPVSSLILGNFVASYIHQDHKKWIPQTNKSLQEVIGFYEKLGFAQTPPR